MTLSSYHFSRIALSALALITLMTPRARSGFNAPLCFDAGFGSVSVAAGDFNRDQIPDLVTANAGSGDISVLLGKGDGTFDPAVHYPTGPESVTVAVADLNGDGIADLAVVNANLPNSMTAGSVSILLGNGDGTFQAAVNYTVGMRPQGLATGDFNGDGRLDLVIGYFPSSDQTVTLLLGNGDGTFQTPQSIPSGTPFSSSVVAADFNGDGKLDLAVIGGEVSILLGNGDGSFQAPVSYTTGSNSYGAAVGDFNGDGIPDLAVVNEGPPQGGHGTVSIFLGNGDGSLHLGQSFDVGSVSMRVAVADPNGDGISDLVVTDEGMPLMLPAQYGRVSVLLGNGDGTFQPHQDYIAGVTPTSVAIVDLNGDGKLDLAVACSRSSSVSVLLGNGDGTFPSATSYPAGGGPRSVAVGDFNRDGIPDLAVANFDTNDVSILLGQGNGSFQAATKVPVGSGSHFVAAADLNGDGILDLAVANVNSNDVAVVLGKGDGTFGAARMYGVGSQPWSLAVGDLNGDGIPDLAVANNGGSPGTVSILLGNGDGTFGNAHNLRAGTAPTVLSLDDFNGDGIPDLAVADSGAQGNSGNSGMVSILLGKGDGSFQPAMQFRAGADPICLAVGDFNGDGKADLAVVSLYPINSAVDIYLGKGDGTFEAAGSYLGGPVYRYVAVGDFNNDGIQDLAVVFDGGVRILVGNGDGTFQTPPVSYLTGDNPYSATVADLNGDGIPDLAVPNINSNDVSILLNDGKWAP